MGRRWVSMLLCLAVLMSMVVSAAADEYDGLRQLMKDSFYSDEMLDISEYGLKVEEVQAIYDELYHSGELPWFADENCDFVYGEDWTIAKFRPKVLHEKVYDRELYEQKIAELIGRTCLPGMTDWQKALSVHDDIILHTVYDGEFEKNTGYDSLINHSTVCYGYAMLYMDVMNRLGIPCQIVICEDTGDGYGHAWNLLQLDGQWYHVDLTWDDPVPDVYGYVPHEHFLKTDEEFRNAETPHDFEWLALETVAEDAYKQDDFLDEVYTALCFVDTNTVVYRQEKGDGYRIVSRDLAAGEETVLYKFDRKDLNLGYGYYLYPTVGLCYWNGRIYFNREDKVLSMLPSGRDVQEVYSLEVDTQYLLGCMVDEGVLYLTLADHDIQTESLEVELEDVEFHTHSYQRNTVPAGCLEDGYYESACDCGIAYNRVAIPKIGHKMQTVVEKAPTYEEPGVTCHSCYICGHTEYEYPPALPVPEVVPEEPEPLPLWIPAVGAGVLGLLLILVLALCRRKKSVRAA